MEKGFFVENFSGEIYKKDFFETEIREFSRREKESRENKSEKNKPVTDPVRKMNEVDLERECFQAVNSNYRLTGDFSFNFSNNFSGKIFSNI